MDDRATLVTLMLVFASQLAYAQDSGIYLGAGMSRSIAGINGDDYGILRVGTVISERSTYSNAPGYKLFGGYNFTRNLAIEVGYANLGRFGYKWPSNDGPASGDDIYTFDYKAASLFASVKWQLPIADQLDVFGKLGITGNNSQATITRDASKNMPHGIPVCPPDSVPCLSGPLTSTIFSRPGSHMKTRADALIGVGLDYAVLKNASIRFEYEDFGSFGNPDNTGRAKLAIWTLGVVYRF